MGIDILAVMSRKNMTFFSSYFGTMPREVAIIPPWGKDLRVTRNTSDSDSLRFIFGGQLARGRGVLEILEAASILEDLGAPVAIEIYGDGPMRDEIASRISALSLTNVRLMPRLEREDYANVLASADVGLAVTVADVTVPTFPSKIVDYASAGLPILVSCEEAGDVGELVQDAGAGLAVPAGEPRALADAMVRFVALSRSTAWTGFSEASRTLFEVSLSAGSVANKIESLLSDERIGPTQRTAPRSPQGPNDATP